MTIAAFAAVSVTFDELRSICPSSIRPAPAAGVPMPVLLTVAPLNVAEPPFAICNKGAVIDPPPETASVPLCPTPSTPVGVPPLGAVRVIVPASTVALPPIVSAPVFSKP